MYSSTKHSGGFGGLSLLALSLAMLARTDSPSRALPTTSMARRARGDDDQARSHPLLRSSSLSSKQSFLNLPDIVHASIAFFLPEGNNSRLRVSESCRALHASYGGSHAVLRICYVAYSSPARLAALLRRHRGLAYVIVAEEKAIPAFCLSIAHGYCLVVEGIELFIEEGILPNAQIDLLVGALEVEGALPALRALTVDCSMEPGGLSKLVRTLAGGTAPLLRHLVFRLPNDVEADLISIVDMLEARARIPGCMRLESFNGDRDYVDWFDCASPDTRIRLLRVLLPSVRKLPSFTWEQAFGPCFCEVQAPYLRIALDRENGGGFPSWNLFEALPALVRIEIFSDNQSPFGGDILASVTGALHHGALRDFKAFKMWGVLVASRRF